MVPARISPAVACRLDCLRGSALALAVLCATGPALGQEDKDLELIPEPVQRSASQATESSAPSAAGQRIYLENAFTQWSLRGGLVVPLPPPEPPHWQERLLLDARKEWRLGERLQLNYSGRFNIRAEDDLSFPTHEDVSHDLREAFLSFEAAARSYVDAGRINLKSGAAAGFNPTDFFKTRAVVQPLTADPAVLREDRLGTLMVRGQHISEYGAVTAAFAPGPYQTTAIYRNVELPSFNPMFGRTNDRNRALLKASADLVGDVSAEVLLYREQSGPYREGSRTRLGANLTESLGRSVVAYAEWAGGRRSSLIDEALFYGTQTGTLPANAPPVLPESSDVYFQNDAAVGLSYTTESPRISFNLEYHYHQAGFSRNDWRNWFTVGHADAGSLPVTNELWYIRAYALDQQEPLARHSVFLRADWVDAFIPKLELSGFLLVDLYDGSSFAQAAADYYVSNTWTIGAVAAGAWGAARSNYGSLPQDASILLKVARYF